MKIFSSLVRVVILFQRSFNNSPCDQLFANLSHMIIYLLLRVMVGYHVQFFLLTN